MLIDRLQQTIQEKSCICVGLDTAYDYIPASMQQASLADTVFAFNKEIIDQTADLVGAFKLQIAYYEAMGIEGLQAYAKTLNYLKEKNLLAIGDIKRGDISATASQYAYAHFDGEFAADFITLSPYMGFDSLEPYLPYLERGDKGVFVLLRTSNKGAYDIQMQSVEGKPLYEHVGEHLAQLGEDYLGEGGYSALGMVVGGTHSEEAHLIRDAYPYAPFLIPGYGAQGAKASDIRVYLGGNMDGGLVNSSRGIIKAYQNYPDGEARVGYYARLAVEAMKEDLYAS